MISLFDEIERWKTEPAGYSEPNFTYLNTSNRSEFIQVRNRLDDWFSRFPEASKLELRRRFRSKNDLHHRSAFFELFLHELMLRLGCQLILHPALENTLKSPDFLVTDGNGDAYLEATVASGKSTAESAAQARANILYDVLDRNVETPDFFLSISIRNLPKSSLPAKDIATSINKFLSTVDYDNTSCIYSTEGISSLPTFIYKSERCEFEIRPIPKSSKLRGKKGVRPIGSRVSTGWMDHRTPLRDAIIQKGKRYSALKLPYVIAVNAMEPIDNEDVIDALFGSENYLIRISDDHSYHEVSEPKRSPDGVWYGPNGIRYTRISAVLIVSQLAPWSIVETEIQLFHNPWAKMKYSGVLTQLNQVIPIGGEIIFQTGIQMSSLFK